MAQMGEVELSQLGKNYLETRRVLRWPLGRVRLPSPDGDPGPDHTDVYLVTHTAGAALWEAWIPAAAQPLDASRHIAWLLSDIDGVPVAVLRERIGTIDREVSSSPALEDGFPFTISRAPGHDPTIDGPIARYGGELVRLVYLDRSRFAFKPAVVSDELGRDFCLRDDGLQLLSQRGALDLRAGEDLGRAGDGSSVLAPHSALPLLVAIELLLMERGVLRLFHERVSTAVPASVQHLLELKAEVLDGLEEYRGTVAASNRFSTEVTSYGKRLLGIDDLYDSLVERLDAVTFEITTRYQQTTNILQFWLTVVLVALGASSLAAAVGYGHHPIPVADLGRRRGDRCRLGHRRGATRQAALHPHTGRPG